MNWLKCLLFGHKWSAWVFSVSHGPNMQVRKCARCEKREYRGKYTHTKFIEGQGKAYEVLFYKAESDARFYL